MPTDLSLVYRLLDSHRADGVKGELHTGTEIALLPDQAFVHDVTGVLALQGFEALGVERVNLPLAVVYSDHVLPQTDPQNADDLAFLQSAAQRHGLVFSKPGNGICHQVHRERFARPGCLLVGADSHTATGGALGMLAIGAGSTDIAVALAGCPYHLIVPKVIAIELHGCLSAFCSGRDVIHGLLQRLGVGGAVGAVLEYCGPGVASLGMADRFTICNMGAELGATSSVFPSDRVTREFLVNQGRGDAWRALCADEGALYDRVIPVDLNALEPLVACPPSPDNVSAIGEVAGIPVDQICVGSCTNSSYEDLAVVAAVLRGQKVHAEVSVVIAPGSRQVLETLAREGLLAELIAAGARVLEAGCGPCAGVTAIPARGSTSLRTFGRNWPGRSGSSESRVFLASPLVCAVSALYGKITDPRSLPFIASVAPPRPFPANDNLLIWPEPLNERPTMDPGNNIQPLRLGEPLPERLHAPVLLKLPDNVSTDDIVPSGAAYFPLRSDIPALSRHLFWRIDSSFSERATKASRSIIVAGENYGQGSSREHAAVACMYSGVRMVIALSFARIHRANLINWGLLPAVFCVPGDYERILPGDLIECLDLHRGLAQGEIVVYNRSRDYTLVLTANLSSRERDLLYSGGLLRSACFS